MELNDITYKVNGCAMKVHNTLGNGFQDFMRSSSIDGDKKSHQLKYIDL